MSDERSAAGEVLCIDIGGTSTKLGLADANGSVEFLRSIPTRGPGESFLQALGEVIREEIHPGLAGIGVAVAGFVSDERDRMVYNSNLPWLENFPLKEALGQAARGLPVEIETDSNTAMLAEYYLGSGRGSKRFLCATVGTGIGVGMISHGEVLRFAYGCMGDAGHVIVQPNGPLCPCGGHGCAEGLISAPALAEEFRLQTGRTDRCTLRDVIQAARAGHEAGVSILQHAGEWLGIACASLANTFFPDRIAIAGGFVEAGDLVMNSIRQAFQYSASKFARDQCQIVRAELGSMATLTGAAFSILTHLQSS